MNRENSRVDTTSVSLILNECQRNADKEHHEGRIAWLSGEAPRWACGARVLKHEAAEMLVKSREALRYIVDHGMSTNSASEQVTTSQTDQGDGSGK